LGGCGVWVGWGVFGLVGGWWLGVGGGGGGGECVGVRGRALLATAADAPMAPGKALNNTLQALRFTVDHMEKP